MIKIKTLKTYNDTIINEFLKQSNGKIVNYNPIVIEYDDEKTNFQDPYKGLNAYSISKGFVEWSKENPINENYEINESIISHSSFDTICFGRHNDTVIFMLNNKEIISSKNCYWFYVSFTSKYIKKETIGIQGYTNQQYQYPFEVYSDVETAIEIYTIEDVFIDENHPKLNYDF